MDWLKRNWKTVAVGAWMPWATVVLLRLSSAVEEASSTVGEVQSSVDQVSHDVTELQDRLNRYR